MVVLYSKLKIRSANYVVSPCIWNSLSQIAAHLPLLHSGLSSDVTYSGHSGLFYLKLYLLFITLSPYPVFFFNFLKQIFRIYF